MKPIESILDPHSEDFRLLTEQLLAKEYSNEILSFIPNLARTLNIYKEYKPNNSVLPERPKKTKLTFVELVWIKIVFELRKIGLDFDIIKELKEFLFKTLAKESLSRELEEKKDELDELLNHLTPLEKKIFHKELKRTFSSNLRHHEIKLSYLLVIIINAVYKKMPVDFRIYLNGRIALHSDAPDDQLIKKEKEPDLLYKSFISISLTEIIGFYLCKPLVNASLKETIFSSDELLILETIKKEKPKSITVEFNADNSIELIKTKKVNNIDINQRLSEIFLNNAYEEVTITTQKGKIVNCIKTKKVKPIKKNTG